MGITKLADKFVHAVPDSVKGGILLAAPVTVMAGQLGEGGTCTNILWRSLQV